MTHTAIATDNEVVPPGDGYVGTLKSVTDGSGQFGPLYDWEFEVDGPDGPVVVSRQTSMKFSPSAKAREFTSALLGREVVKGEKIDLDDLIGRRASLTIATNEKGWSTITDITSAPVGDKLTDAIPF